MTEQEFQKLLDDHDWFYMMSDDPRIWDRGKASEDKLKSYFPENPEFQAMYKKKEKEYFPQ